MLLLLELSLVFSITIFPGKTHGFFFLPTYMPPQVPAQDINELATYANTVIDIIKEASLPDSWEDVIAIGTSESIAGLIGGSAAITVQNMLGDKKPDSFLTKEAVSGVFFGARSMGRGVAEIMGLPSPLPSILGNVAGSFASEGAKEAGRIAESNTIRPAMALKEVSDKITPKSTDSINWWLGNNNSDTMKSNTKLKLNSIKFNIVYNALNKLKLKSLPSANNSSEITFKRNTSFPKLPVFSFPLPSIFTPSPNPSTSPPPAAAAVPTSVSVADTPVDQLSSQDSSTTLYSQISVPELTLDVGKWVIYDLLVSQYEVIPLHIAALDGAVAGVTSLAIIEMLRHVGVRQFQGEFSFWAGNDMKTRFFRAFLEGAALFWAYQIARTYCNQIVPENVANFLGNKFDFYKFELIDYLDGI
mmetsp:Transcript_6307/g.6518  ORF Transcript_6307/g.6518 Transcript_6307/m.6518 type:complete len:416 (+) Transcript_6307:48-1295(+)